MKTKSVMRNETLEEAPAARALHVQCTLAKISVCFPQEPSLGAWVLSTCCSPKARQSISTRRMCCRFSNASVPHAVSSPAADSGFGKSGQRGVLASRVGAGACGVLERVNYREGLTAMQSHAPGLYYSYTLTAENWTWDVWQATESLQRQWSPIEAKALSVRCGQPCMILKSCRSGKFSPSGRERWGAWRTFSPFECSILR